MIDEFAIREVLGVKTVEKRSSIIAEELSSVVQIVIESPNESARAICLKPDEALKFSRQLSRVVRRIEVRNA